MLYFRFVLLNVFWIVAIYAFNSLLARRAQKVAWQRAIVYISTLAVLGPLGEIVVDSSYHALTGMFLWSYNYWPVHSGNTSLYAPILWGTFGFYLCLLHDNVRVKWSGWQAWQLALVFSFEALVLEALADAMSKIALDNFIYYYYPSNLLHVSAIQNIPIYFLFGYLVIETVKLFLKSPKVSVPLNGCLLAIFIWLT